MPKKKTHEEFLEDFKKLVGDEYTPLSIYEKMSVKILVRHNSDVCDRHEWMITPNKILMGRRCPKCNEIKKSERMRKTHKEYLKEFNAVSDSRYTLLGEYKGDKKPILIRHENESCDNHEWSPLAGSFLAGHGCPKCAGNYRMTDAEFKEKLKEKNDEIISLNNFKHMNEKIWFRHNSEKCNFHEWEATPSNVIYNNSSCPKCGGTLKKTTKQFKQEVYNLVGDEYTVVGKYINSNEKITMKHEECNTLYDILPYSFTANGSRCPKCANEKLGIEKRKSAIQFRKDFERIAKKEYTLITEYSVGYNKIRVRHNEAECNNYEYDVIPSSFMRGSRCPKCAGRCRTTESFKQEVYNLVGDEYTVLGEYINAHTPIEIRHNNSSCDYYTRGIRPVSFIGKGTRCSRCSGRESKDMDRYCLELNKKWGGFIKLRKPFKKMTDKTLFIHYKKNGDVCHTWEATPSAILNGSGCPKCNESRGEKEIRSLLEKKRIHQKSQYRLEDCRNKKVLPFDFAIFNDNGTLNCLIEFDGKQHFEPVNRFGGEKGFRQRQHNDQIKNQYCKDNNIKLIRIPYWDFDNIEDILNEELKDLINNNEDEVSA